MLPLVALVFAGDFPEDCLPSVTTLRRGHPEIDVVVGGEDEDALAPLAAKGAVTRAAPSLCALANRVYEETRCHLLLVCEPAVFPDRAVDPALAVAEEHLQTATVSFLSNAAGFASFPEGDRPVSHQISGAGGVDEQVITDRLRHCDPALAMVPLPFAIGPAVLVSGYAASAVGPLAEVVPPAQALADFSLRGRRKGFVDLLEPSTFVMRAFDVGHAGEATAADVVDDWLVTRHPEAKALVEETRGDDHPLAISRRAARAKVLGLHVLVDGYRLWPREMGTQVQTVALVEALARRADVDRVAVALGDELPAYAERLARNRKVDARRAKPDELSVFGRIDVAHRPFQPDGPHDVDPLRKVAARTAITLLDLIAYQIGAYHPTVESWMAYRKNVRHAAADFDAVLVLSGDVRRYVEIERLPVERDRLFILELGTDHLHGIEPQRTPPALLARDGASEQFLLVIGPNYAHKNRDLAIRAATALRRRGLPMLLVMAGSTVPRGSSRVLEASAWEADDDVVVLPNVSSEERNWLLRHASLVLYLSSAEGFGLVPFEAARFGTPTVLLPVGPLKELADALPAVASDWSAEAVADAAEQLLTDPAVADKQVAAILASDVGQTWDATAAELVRVYRSTLARPRRVSTSGW